MPNKIDLTAIDQSSVISVGAGVIKLENLASIVLHNFETDKNHDARLNSALVNNGFKIQANTWFEPEGASCEILVPGQEWQKGNIRVNVSLEFIPAAPEELDLVNSDSTNTEQSEFPLDDIRRSLSN